MAVAAGDGLAELQGRNWLIVDLIDAGERALAEAEIARYARAGRAAPDPGAPCGTRWPGARRSPTSTATPRPPTPCGPSWSSSATAASIRTSTSCCARRWACGGWWRSARSSWRRSSRTCTRRRSSRTSRGCGGAASRWSRRSAATGRRRRQHLALAGRPADSIATSTGRRAIWEHGAAAMLLGDVERAREARDLLAPFASTTVTAIRATCIYGPAASLLARLDAYLVANDTGV